MNQDGADNPNWRGGVAKDNMRYKRVQKLRYPERVRARELVRRAIRAGRIAKQPCGACGAPVAHAHHEDYSKPLAVVWMCKACHDAEHVAHPQPKFAAKVETACTFDWRGRTRRW